MNLLQFEYLYKDDQIYFGENTYAKTLYTNYDDLVENAQYIKCTYEINIRDHVDDVYCSDHEYSDEEAEPFIVETMILYFIIPKFLLEKNKIKDEFLDDDSNIIINKKTEKIFNSWRLKSNCCGSEVCNYYDDYRVIKIEYVTIYP
jgi:hypothetical protein